MNLSKIILKIQEKPGMNKVLSKIFNLLGVRTKLNGYKNRVDYNGSLLYKVKIVIKGDYNFISIGNLSKMKNCVITINGSYNKIEIGSSCYINNTDFSITNSKNGSLILGDNTTINGGLLHAGESKTIQIGTDCMFSSNIDIRTTDSHSIIDMENGQRINKAANVIIGNHVWLGNSSKVWKGAEIGSNSVIGAGSIVTKSIKKNCIAVGIPAKEIKRNINWDRKLL